MRQVLIAAGLVAASLMSTSAFAQNTAPARDTKDAKAAEVTLPAPHWRSSKLIGVNIYNEQGEKLGDINEVLLDPAGKVLGYVIGVGGFLGMGEHDVMVEPSKIKFTNEPVRTTTNTKSDAPAANTSTTTNRNTADTWYPDHGVFNATKDQLKALPQFKYTAAAK